ncbi:bacteriohemerythrin [Parendozoicomonas sp. Alg238-R29]|uniref:bacteriohemerythrin n=1 Tax=Parendozoicomonas sp. Alg238-R29 TaxID=2993446 RepID=UPI00248E8292|nr:bacteriohemerythrin [Parendozoicomonas sp. Alg238-R29]
MLSNNNRELITWTDEFSVGIQEIDEQHKTLVDLLNNLYVAIREHHGNKEATNTLCELATYTRIHFTVEESLMSITGYPEYEKHKYQHKLLADQLNEFQEKVVNGTPISVELLHFLKNWLTHHILEDDMAYAPHMIKKGIRTHHTKRSLIDRLLHRQ